MLHQARCSAHGVIAAAAHARSRDLSPRDCAAFPVSTDLYLAGVTTSIVVGYVIWFPHMFTLASGQRDVQTLKC
jgi:hypothetical protein